MGDEFTSVQWDRDDLEPQPIVNMQSAIFEEEENENGHDHDSEQLSAPEASVAVNTKSTESYSDEATNYYVHSTVSEPLKESDGSNHYITYLIKTKTNDPNFKTQEFQIRRRFSDFSFLYQCLLNEFPTVIVPSLPNKQRLEYIKGDRFSEYFTTKRAISLNNFLSRISKHDLLKNSKIYHNFLESTEYWNSYKLSSKLNGSASSKTSETNEKISDYIMNAFKKPTIQTENTKEFQEIVTKSNKLQDNLVKIDKVYSKVLKKQNDLSSNFSKLGDELVKLNRLINDNTEEETSDLDQSLVKNFKALSNNLHRISSASDELTMQVDYEFLTSLKDLEHYIALLKNAFKLKDSKLIDYEALSSYLTKAINEKEAILQNGSVSTTEATLKFLTKKLESFTGSDVGSGSSNSTNNKILKLNSKITKLEQESQTALAVFENFEKQLLKEYYTKFEPIKTEEINESLNKLAKLNIVFYDTVLKNWENLDNSLVKNKREFPSVKLEEGSKLYAHLEITKNENAIKRDYGDLVKIHDKKLNQRQEEVNLQSPRTDGNDDDQITDTKATVKNGTDENEEDEEDEEEDDLLTASMLA